MRFSQLFAISLCISFFTGFFAYGDPGLPQKASILSSVDGPVTTVDLPDLKLNLARGTCSSGNWDTISDINWGQGFSIVVKGQRYESFGLGYATRKTPSVDCTLRASDISSLHFTVAHSQLKSVQFNVYIDFVSKRFKMIQKSVEKNNFPGYLSAAGEITAWY